ncbi:MAG: penicillin-binding transpeptidase domain-containing protein [bacterium]
MNTLLVRRRIAIFFIAILIAFSVIFVRLGYMTFFLSDLLTPKAYLSWSREVPIEGKRGNIYDRNGELIVGNMLSPSIASINKQVINKEETASQIAYILECDDELILNHLNKNVSVELIKPEGRRISVEQAEAIIELNLDGIYVVGDTVRYYPHDTTLAHTLGFTGIDNQGIAGLEYMYDEFLKGQDGSLSIYTDAKGNQMPDMLNYYNTSSQGFDLYLTIDLMVQLVVERVMDEAIARYDPDSMYVIVNNPQTGEVLAMSSYPTFSPANYQDYDQEIYNRNLPIWKSFEPGSTFKFMTYSAGLEEEVFDFNEHYFDPGYKMVSGVRINNWKTSGHGDQTFLEVIQNSCNPGFMEIGERLGVETFYDYLYDYGFGQKTGIDLLGETSGIIMNENSVGPVELATMSFGQTNSASAIQILNAASAAVNGGYLNTPFVLSKITDQVDNVLLQKETEEIRQVISEDTSTLMRHALESVVAYGTGRGGYVDGYRVGGKTGTAQKVGENGQYMDNNYILSFLGIAPMDNPQVGVYLAIDNPKNTIQYGGVVAAPLVGEILSEILPALGIKTDYENQLEKELRYYIDPITYTVPNLIGQNSITYTKNYNINYVVLGNGSTIIEQSPVAGEKVAEGGTIILYTG